MSLCSQTALLHAANHNHHLMVADLISLGANVNETNNLGKSCLHLSAEKGYIRVLEVRALLSSLPLKMHLGQGLCCLLLHVTCYFSQSIWAKHEWMMRLIIGFKDLFLNDT